MDIRIKSIKKIAKQDRYDLTVSTTNNFYANGILIHNTSGRCSILPVKQKRNVWDRLIGRTRYKDQFVVGSRKVMKSIEGNEVGNKKHFYDHDLWTIVSTEIFKDVLSPGETVYFEIVGYLPDGGLIMPNCDNKKLKSFMDKEEYKNFIDLYGDVTSFTYLCRPSEFGVYMPYKQYRVYVYRMTKMLTSGEHMDLSHEQLQKRCEEMNVGMVPILDKFIVTEEDMSDLDGLMETIEVMAANSSSLFPEHVREGVCVRIDKGHLQPRIYKHKSFIFKVLEGIIKDTEAVDIEESN